MDPEARKPPTVGLFAGRRVRSTVVTGVVAAALAAMSTVPAAAQELSPTRVASIRLDPDAHVNEIRMVEGVVDRLVSRGADEAPSFYLEDDFGHQILVIPLDAAPRRGARVTVTGVVTLDPAGDPVLTLFEPMDAGADEPAPPPEVEPPPTPSAGPAGPPRTFLLLGAAALVGLLVLGAFRLGRVASDAPRPLGGDRSVGPEVDFPTASLWPESDQEFDGRTMRFTRPDPTVLLMPAKLEVMTGGDAGTEIPFVAAQDDDRVELMIGRAAGEGPGHIQLKEKTVSRTHAVIRFRHDEWLLENLSMTNPTVLNDEVLGVKEQLLSDGDLIEMGEVTFRFRLT